LDLQKKRGVGSLGLSARGSKKKGEKRGWGDEEPPGEDKVCGVVLDDARETNMDWFIVKQSECLKKESPYDSAGDGGEPGE